MGVTTLTLPRLGETMEEARVLDWLKAPGEDFRRGDVLLEVETDKTVVEVPALVDGRMGTHLVAPGETVRLGQPIAEIETGAAPVSAALAAAPAVSTPIRQLTAPGRVPLPEPSAGRPAASPRARALARGAGIPLAEVPGTGRRGRITGADVARLLALPANDARPHDTRPGGIAVRRWPSDGGGAPILLLHGLFDQGRGWRDLPARLAEAGHPVIVPDLPGHGASPAMPDGLESTAAALAGLVPAGPLRIAGHSLGAVLATWVAGLLGPRVERLVLISPAGLGPRINADFPAMMLAARTPAALARALTLLGGGPLSEVALRSELERLREGRAAMARLAGLLARDGLQQLDIARDLDRLMVPVTAIFGLQDRILDWHDCAALPARAAIHLLRDAGHLPHVADPGLVAALIAGPARSAAGQGAA